MKIFIGLMGVDSNNTLITPKGKKLFKVPSWLSWRIQIIQHELAMLTWPKYYLPTNRKECVGPLWKRLIKGNVENSIIYQK